jgi:RNA polymerase sigma-70 factor (ECF subfamily)
MGSTDEQLWRASGGGDAEAFAELYERYVDAIYNYCFRRTGDWTASEDLTAAVFLAAWAKRARVRFTAEASVRPWLYGVAANVVRNYARGHRRFLRALARAATQPVPRVAGDTAARVADEERMRAILAAVNRLPDIEREVLALCVFAELTYEDAAAALEIPVGTVRSRLARARARLSELLREDGHVSECKQEMKSEANDARNQPSPVS